MKTILDMFPEKSVWPMLLIGATLAGAESGVLPTPTNKTVLDLEKRMIAAEIRLSQASEDNGKTNKHIDDLGERVDENTKVLHEVEVNQGRMSQKLDDIGEDVSEDLKRLFNKLDGRTSTREPYGVP